MSNEDLKQTSWKAKLEAMNGLEGETPFDATAAWNKLYLRLNKKKRSPIARWYWLAAASLIEGVITTLFFYSQKKSTPKEQFNAIVKEKMSKNNIGSIIRNDSSIKDLPAITHNESMSTKENLVKIVQGQHAKIVTREIMIRDSVSNVSTVSASIKASQVVDSTIYATAIVPQKKKLKVVHINTIEEPVRLPQYMVRTHGKTFSNSS